MGAALEFVGSGWSKQGAEMSQWLLGLGGSDHDFSAALSLGTDLRVAIEEERLSRRKHSLPIWYENPNRHSIAYCLQAERINLEDVEVIVSSDTLPARTRHELRTYPLKVFPHHLCHAASAYMMLPAKTRAGILVWDGYGSILSRQRDTLRAARETISFFLFHPDGYERLGGTEGMAFLESDDFPICVTNSVGMFYELVTGMLGYDPLDAGKVMGLSAYGAPKYEKELAEFVTFGNTMSDCFQCRVEDSALTACIDQLLLSRGGSFSVKADIAASLQAFTDKALLHCAGFFAGIGIQTLCVSGGCALNTVATSNLVENAPFDVPIVSPPQCGDSGLAFGAICLELLERGHKMPCVSFRGCSDPARLSRPGRSYSRDERQSAAQEFYPRLVHDPSVASPVKIAELLAQGAVIGALNGPSEFGPRALGGRSIFADPRSVLTRERINRILKRREPFRPLAPIVLRADYDTYFEDPRLIDEFMLKNARVRHKCIIDAPASVHIDGTARVQVIDTDGDPFLVELLSAFKQLTGVGILLNTSFNRRGEPIVETPRDAIDAFLGMGLDGLYLDGDYYRPVSKSLSS
jgi:carbamoyltransferase